MIVLLTLLVPQWMAGYSMLTHEEIVDLAWEDRIQPLWTKQFPRATPDDLVYYYHAIPQSSIPLSPRNPARQ